MKLSFWSTIIMLAAALTLAVPATARPVRSTVTVEKATSDPGGVDMRGKVTSRRLGCKSNRTVELFHDVEPPSGPGPEDFPLGSTKTNSDGNWRHSTAFFPHKVYAIVKQKR